MSIANNKCRYLFLKIFTDCAAASIYCWNFGRNRAETRNILLAFPPTLRIVHMPKIAPLPAALMWICGQCFLLLPPQKPIKQWCALDAAWAALKIKRLSFFKDFNKEAI